MKAGIFKQFILISLLFSLGIAIGMLSNPALLPLDHADVKQEKNRPVIKHSKKKQRYARLSTLARKDKTTHRRNI